MAQNAVQPVIGIDIGSSESTVIFKILFQNWKIG